MREIFLNTWLLVGAFIAILSFAFFYANTSGDPMWFARAGSLATVLGLLLTLKHSILSSSRDIHTIVAEKFHYAVYAPARNSPEYDLNMKAAKRMLRQEYLGLFFTILGTVIWGYGDIIHVAIMDYVNLKLGAPY